MVLIISCLHKLYVFPSWKIHVLCILIPSRYITFFLDTTPIHRAYFLTFCLLDTYVNLLKSFSTPSSIPPIDRAPLACFSCVSHVLHFFFSSLYVHSILFSCFSGRSMFPCSPYSFYASFLFVSSHVFFLAFYALWQSCQKWGEIWVLNVIP